MTRSWPGLYLTTLSCFVLSVRLSSFAAAAGPTFELQTDPSVDEQLFLLDCLEMLNSSLPSAESGAQQVTAQLLSQRHNLNRIREYMDARKMDGVLLALYDDSIKLSDVHRELLTDLGILDSEYARRFEEQSLNSAISGLSQSMGASSALAGVEPTTATVAIVGLIGSHLINSYGAQQQLNGEMSGTLERRTQQYLVERSRLLARIEVQAGILAERHGWTRDEVGIGRSEQEAQTFAQAMIQNNLPFVRDELEKAKKLRPRNSLVYAFSGALRQVEATQVADHQGDSERVRLLKMSVADFIRAAELVPTNTFHDEFRATYLLLAADSAANASYWARKNTTWPWKLFDAALQYQQRDPGGSIAHLKAVALKYSGDYQRSLTELRQWSQAHGEDAAYHYEMACLLSLSNDPAAAMQHLTKSWNLGNRLPRWYRRDFQLESVRRNCPEFEKLLAPSFNSNLSYGYVWNDLLVDNTSSYPLSNAAIHVRWGGKDGQEYREVYWLESLPAGVETSIQGALRNAKQSDQNSPGLETRIICDEMRAISSISVKELRGRYSGIDTLIRDDATRVGETAEAWLSIEDDGGDSPELKFEVSDQDVRFALKPSVDNCSELVGIAGSEGQGSVWFHNRTVYGWYMLKSDRENGERHAFWFERHFDAPEK